jgi:hypothetical protein
MASGGKHEGRLEKPREQEPDNGGYDDEDDAARWGEVVAGG